MTKSDITERIHTQIGDREGFTRRESVEMLETVLGIIKNTLEAGEKVKIASFGCFEVKQKTDRKGRNPQTGETITIKARRILTFKPSKLLREAINE